MKGALTDAVYDRRARAANADEVVNARQRDGQILIIIGVETVSHRRSPVVAAAAQLFRNSSTLFSRTRPPPPPLATFRICISACRAFVLRHAKSRPAH